MIVVEISMEKRVEAIVRGDDLCIFMLLYGYPYAYGSSDYRSVTVVLEDAG
jgi:hypothetical protein